MGDRMNWTRSACKIWLSLTLALLPNGPLLAASRLSQFEKVEFQIGSRPYILATLRNAQGAVTEQHLITEGRTEISRDITGSGHLTSWELVTPGRRVIMHTPQKGHFNFMEIERVTKSVIYSVKFIRTSQGTYRPFRVRTQARIAQNSVVQSDIVAGCHEAEKELQRLAGNVNDLIKISGKLSNALDGVLHNSCKTGAFKDRTDKILEAMRTIFRSDQTWSSAAIQKFTDAGASGAAKSVSSQGTYLQCLRYHRLDQHASRIEAALAGYIGAERQVFPWQVRCEGANPLMNWGNYTPQDGKPPIITLFDKKEPDGKLTKRAGRDEPYTTTFFHEMLHYSLIPDGSPILNATLDCCVQDSPEKKSCKELDQLVTKQMRKQQVENQIANKLGNDQYATFVDLIGRKLRDSQKGDIALEDFASGVAGVYARLETKKNCDFSDKTKTTAICSKLLKEELKKEINGTFTDPEIREALAVVYDLRNAPTCDQKHSRLWDELVPQAFASNLDNLDGQLCKLVASEARSFSDNSLPQNADYRPELPSASPTFLPVAETDETAAEVGATKIVKPDAKKEMGSGATQIHYESSYAGPPRPDYSLAPSNREAKIEADIARIDTKFSRIESQLLGRLLGTTEAHAEEVSSGNDSYRTQVPKMDVPDPLAGAPTAQRENPPPSRQTLFPNPASKGLGSKTATLNSIPTDVPLAPIRSSASQKGIQSVPTRSQASTAAPNTFSSGGSIPVNQPQPDPHLSKTGSKAEDEEARAHAFLLHLQEPFERIRPELRQPATLEQMEHYFIRAIDDHGQSYGSKLPKRGRKLIYSPRLKRLILEEEMNQ